MSMSDDFSEHLSEYTEGVGTNVDHQQGGVAVLASPDQTDDMESQTSESCFEISQCKAETVTVYLDRAEVARTLKSAIKSGENEVIVTGLSPSLDKDSVR